MTTPPTPEFIYLHGGPGMSADVERLWFGGAHPVLWWNQPRIASAIPNAFHMLVDAAEARVRQLAEAKGRPIGVISSSFGARIAIELAYRRPDCLRSLTLLAPTLSVEEGLMRLTTHLLDAGAGNPPLLSAYASALTTRSHEAFLGVVNALFSTPDLLSHYWSGGTEPLQLRHSQLLETVGNWFDLDTFVAISRDLFDKPLPETQTPDLPATIFFGRHDPLFSEKLDLDRWKALFPHATIHLVAASHMVPFECPIEDWLI